jgi:TetR/AcrR family transcriptional regulator, cholesterol catabolism regulator
MQFKKEDIRQTIIDKAREEFLIKGFKDASMRTIAKDAGVGLSNIYNYFKNKDDLFCEVLAPTLTNIREAMTEHNSEKYMSLDIFTSEEYQYQNMNLFVDLLEKSRVGLKLLLFQASGSSLENFREDFTDQYTKTGMLYLMEMKERYPHLNSNISEFFMHTASSWWLSIIGEIVSHNLTNEQTRLFIAEYIEFGVAGWKRIMKA